MFVSVRRGDATEAIGLTPIVGVYDKVTPAGAQHLVDELVRRLGITSAA